MTTFGGLGQAESCRKSYCNDCGHEFTFAGQRRPKRCPACKAEARRAQDRARKGGYGKCWGPGCGKRRPLSFDREGPVDHDFEVAPSFCGVLCWLRWLDATVPDDLSWWYASGMPGAPRVVVPRLLLEPARVPRARGRDT